MIIKNDGKTPEGVIFSDLGNLCQPSCNIGTEDVLDQWVAWDYETAAVSGTMLTAMSISAPKPVVLHPNLQGWYKIYVSLMDNPDNRVFLRLTGDAVQDVIRPGAETFGMTMWKWERLQECLWKCADMTGQSVEIARRAGMGTAPCQIAWLRFVPMTEEEIAHWKREEERKDTKRIFATMDMYGTPVAYGANTHNEYHTIIERMRHSDVKIYSLEVSGFGEEHDSVKGPDFAFSSDMSRFVYHKMLGKTGELYESMIQYGHACGLEIYLGRRMGARLGCVAPHDGQNRNTAFGRANQHLRCKDRDGAWIDAMSFAYKAVQDEAIEAFTKYVELGCDGITLIYSRGIPYVLFEEPVQERFKQKYPDVNPCEVPLADPRIYEIHCEVMTEFMRRLKTALNARRAELGMAPVKIHAVVGSSLLDNKHIGLDVETWAKEGLVDSISATPLRITERVEGLMQEAHPDLIDLEKYTKAVRESFRKIIHRDVEGDMLDGTWKPLATIELEHVAEYVRVDKTYGIDVYFDILDRQKPSEVYIKNALDLIAHGGEKFSLWDCDVRAEIMTEWETASRLGHIEELKAGTFAQNPSTLYRMLSIRGKNISLYNPAWMG